MNTMLAESKVARGPVLLLIWVRRGESEPLYGRGEVAFHLSAVESVCWWRWVGCDQDEKFAARGG